MKNKITLNEISKELNISKSSVSKAISRKAGVSDDARSRIIETAKKLNYPIDLEYQNNNYRKPQNATLIIEKEAFTNAFFWVKIIDSLESELKRNDINMTIYIVENNNDTYFEEDNYKTDGYIVLGLVSEQILRSIEKKNLPIVLVDYKSLDEKHDHIRMNNYQAMKHMTELILRKNHVNMLFVGDINFAASYKERYLGIKDCLEEYPNIITKLDLLEIKKGIKTIEERDQLLSRLSQDDPPTVIICANDLLALECISILKKVRFKIPEEISVVGFDNIQEGNFEEPKLTTVAVSKIDLAVLAVETLLKKIEKPKKTNLLIMIEAKIIERNSLAERRSK